MDTTHTEYSAHVPMIVWTGKHLDAELSIVACKYCSVHAPVGSPINVSFTMVATDVSFVGEATISFSEAGVLKLLEAITVDYNSFIMTQKQEGLDNGAHLN